MQALVFLIFIFVTLEFVKSSSSCSCTQYGGGYCSGFCNGNTCPCMNCQYMNQTCGATIEDIKQMKLPDELSFAGEIKLHYPFLLGLDLQDAVHLIADEEVPNFFDWRPSGLLSTDLNQHIPTYCGSCWYYFVILISLQKIIQIYIYYL